MPHVLSIDRHEATRKRLRTQQRLERKLDHLKAAIPLLRPRLPALFQRKGVSLLDELEWHVEKVLHCIDDLADTYEDSNA
jgi:hypothetical protein